MPASKWTLIGLLALSLWVSSSRGFAADAPGPALSALAGRLTSLEVERQTLGTNLSALRQQITQMAAERERLGTSILALQREIERHLDAAEKAEKRHSKAAKK